MMVYSFNPLIPTYPLIPQSFCDSASLTLRIIALRGGRDGIGSGDMGHHVGIAFCYCGGAPPAMSQSWASSRAPSSPAMPLNTDAALALLPAAR
jgi:hypothetical protein